MSAMSELTWVDYGIVGLIALSSLIGLLRGLLREVLSLVAWVAALGVAFTFSGQAAPLLEPYIGVPSLRQTAAFAALFLGTLLVMGLVNFTLASLVARAGLGATDRFLGLVFGVARGVLVVALLVLLAGFTPFPKDPWWGEARLLGHFEEMAKWGRQHLPDEVRRLVAFRGEARREGRSEERDPGRDGGRDSGRDGGRTAEPLPTGGPAQPLGPGPVAGPAPLAGPAPVTGSSPFGPAPAGPR